MRIAMDKANVFLIQHCAEYKRGCGGCEQMSTVGIVFDVLSTLKNTKTRYKIQTEIQTELPRLLVVKLQSSNREY